MHHGQRNNGKNSHLIFQKLNEDALAHATMQYNIQLSQLKTENTVLISNLEKERNSKDKIEAEVSISTNSTNKGVS